MSSRQPSRRSDADANRASPMLPSRLASGTPQAVADGFPRLGRREPGFERGIFEKGDEKLVDAPSQVDFGNLGGDPERREFPLSGFQLPVTDEPAGEGREPGRA